MGCVKKFLQIIYPVVVGLLCLCIVPLSNCLLVTPSVVVASQDKIDIGTKISALTDTISFLMNLTFALCVAVSFLTNHLIKERQVINWWIALIGVAFVLTSAWSLYLGFRSRMIALDWMTYSTLDMNSVVQAISKQALALNIAFALGTTLSLEALKKRG